MANDLSLKLVDRKFISVYDVTIMPKCQQVSK